MNVSKPMQKTNAGTCPHGNPIGTCPICAGLSGGGGGLASNKPRKPGEMTYDQCYAIWQQMLKAKALKEEQKLQQKIDYAKAQEKIQSFSEKLMDKISALNIRAIEANTNNKINPTISSRIQAFILNSSVAAINLVKTVINITQKAFNFIQQKFADISDKLTAIFGELKLAIKKRLSEKFNFKTKIKSIFHIFNPLNINNEEKKIDEEKLIFKLKTTLSMIKEKFSNKKLKE